VREAVQIGGRQVHQLQQLGDAGVASARIGHAIHQQRLANDFGDRHTWIERGERVLEDHLHLSPQRAQFLASKPSHVNLGPSLSAEAYFARGWSNGAQDAARGGGLAAALLADQRQGFTPVDGEADVIDRAHVTREAAEQAAVNWVELAQFPNVEDGTHAAVSARVV
jgi:hypothetical protein